MRQIEDYFVDSVGQDLYHYTGVDSLLGISKSKTLWASNAYFMNDSSEITHACDVLDSVLEPQFIFGDHQSPDYEFKRQVREWVGSCRTTTYNIFVFSLSEQPSQLSQWRSYTPHGKGVSIGLSGETVAAIARTSCLRIAKCLYTREEHEGLVRSLLDRLLITFRQQLPNINITEAHPSQCYHPFLEGFRGHVLQVLSIIKHRAFEEEREWRLISPYYPKYVVPDIKFREGASMLVPYIEIPLGDGKPCFSSVTLGPSQHQNLSMSALSMFSSNQGLCNVTSNCGIPYREWT